MSPINKRSYLFINKTKPNKVLQSDDANVIFTLETHQWPSSSGQAVFLRRHQPTGYILQIGPDYLFDDTVIQLKPPPKNVTSKYLWSLSKEDSNGLVSLPLISLSTSMADHSLISRYIHIHNIGTGKYLRRENGTNVVEAGPKTSGDRCYWKVILLPTLEELKDNGK